jgi:isopentenyl diphosphate isomerase/L-lactate dehydrogenase-like FMN-dependent dehydrogenase
MEPLPVNVREFEARAEQALDRTTWEFIAGGALDEFTLRRNRSAFESILLRPRRLIDVRSRDLSTTVLGERISFPVMIAPTGVHGRAHPDGEVATARAAGSAGTLMSLGTGATCSIEDVAAVATGPLWFQLYHCGDDLTEMLIRRAEAAGYSAICVTVDVPVQGTGKERDRRNEFKPLIGVELANFVGERAGLGLVHGEPRSSQWVRPPIRPVTWEKIAWLRSLTRLPIVLKGIMTWEDAKLCAEHGIDGILVSNHGGRVVDSVAATIEVLPEVVDAAGGACEVYLDGGIRRGSDALKALALGARAVLIGRPFWYGLAVAGEEGVRAVLEILRRELDEAMMFCGKSCIAEIDRSVVSVPTVPQYQPPAPLPAR